MAYRRPETTRLIAIEAIRSFTEMSLEQLSQEYVVLAETTDPLKKFLREACAAVGHAMYGQVWSTAVKQAYIKVPLDVSKHVYTPEPPPKPEPPEAELIWIDHHPFDSPDPAERAERKRRLAEAKRKRPHIQPEVVWKPSIDSDVILSRTEEIILSDPYGLLDHQTETRRSKEELPRYNARLAAKGKPPHKQ